MSKRLVALALAIVVAATCAVAFALPDEWAVERTLVVHARAEHVLAVLSTPKHWATWNRLLVQGGTPITNPVPSGPGAAVEWSGDAAGQLVIEAVEPEKGLQYRVVRADAGDASGRFRLAPSLGGDGTRVEWTESGRVGLSPFARFGLRRLERRLGEELEASLPRLETLAAQIQQEADEKAALVAAAEAERRAAEEAERAAAEAADRGPIVFVPPTPAPDAPPPEEDPTTLRAPGAVVRDDRSH